MPLVNRDGAWYNDPDIGLLTLQQGQGLQNRLGYSIESLIVGEDGADLPLERTLPRIAKIQQILDAVDRGENNVVNLAGLNDQSPFFIDTYFDNDMCSNDDARALLNYIVRCLNHPAPHNTQRSYLEDEDNGVIAQVGANSYTINVAGNIRQNVPFGMLNLDLRDTAQVRITRTDVVAFASQRMRYALEQLQERQQELQQAQEAQPQPPQAQEPQSPRNPRAPRTGYLYTDQDVNILRDALLFQSGLQINNRNRVVTVPDEPEADPAPYVTAEDNGHEVFILSTTSLGGGIDPVQTLNGLNVHVGNAINDSGIRTQILFPIHQGGNHWITGQILIDRQHVVENPGGSQRVYNGRAIFMCHDSITNRGGGLPSAQISTSIYNYLNQVGIYCQIVTSPIPNIQGTILGDSVYCGGYTGHLVHSLTVNPRAFQGQNTGEVWGCTAQTNLAQRIADRDLVIDARNNPNSTVDPNDRFLIPPRSVQDLLGAVDQATVQRFQRDLNLREISEQMAQSMSVEDALRVMHIFEQKYVMFLAGMTEQEREAGNYDPDLPTFNDNNAAGKSAIIRDLYNDIFNLNIGLEEKFPFFGGDLGVIYLEGDYPKSYGNYTMAAVNPDDLTILSSLDNYYDTMESVVQQHINQAFVNAASGISADGVVSPENIHLAEQATDDFMSSSYQSVKGNFQILQQLLYNQVQFFEENILNPGLRQGQEQKTAQVPLEQQTGQDQQDQEQQTVQDPLEQQPAQDQQDQEQQTVQDPLEQQPGQDQEQQPVQVPLEQQTVGLGGNLPSSSPSSPNMQPVLLQPENVIQVVNEINSVCRISEMNLVNQSSMRNVNGAIINEYSRVLNDRSVQERDNVLRNIHSDDAYTQYVRPSGDAEYVGIGAEVDAVWNNGQLLLTFTSVDRGGKADSMGIVAGNVIDPIHMPEFNRESVVNHLHRLKTMGVIKDPDGTVRINDDNRSAWIYTSINKGENGVFGPKQFNNMQSLREVGFNYQNVVRSLEAGRGME